MVDDGIGRSIRHKADSGIEFGVEFSNAEESQVVLAFLRLEDTVRLIECERKLRIRCQQEGAFCVPIEDPPNQMLKLVLAAAASYPTVLPAEFIERRLGIPFNSYKVYASSKDYESSKYLTMDKDKSISISAQGVPWAEGQFASNG